MLLNINKNFSIAGCRTPVVTGIGQRGNFVAYGTMFYNPRSGFGGSDIVIRTLLLSHVSVLLCAGCLLRQAFSVVATITLVFGTYSIITRRMPLSWFLSSKRPREGSDWLGLGHARECSYLTGQALGMYSPLEPEVDVERGGSLKGREGCVTRPKCNGCEMGKIRDTQ